MKCVEILLLVALGCYMPVVVFIVLSWASQHMKEWVFRYSNDREEVFIMMIVIDCNSWSCFMMQNVYRLISSCLFGSSFKADHVCSTVPGIMLQRSSEEKQPILPVKAFQVCRRACRIT